LLRSRSNITTPRLQFPTSANPIGAAIVAILIEKNNSELGHLSWQPQPGLNATNMAILVGQKLNGALGAVVAVLGICLPGSLLMFAAGIFYRIHGDHAWATGALKGVAAASIGLVLSTVVQLSKRSLEDRLDYVFVILTVLAVNRLHQSVLTTLVVIGLMAVLWHRPCDEIKEEAVR
jgi:chromate transporter